jgi:hypothetical protein
MPQPLEPPFWENRESIAASLATARRPASADRFVRESQRYQRLSDRLQAEMSRQQEHIDESWVTNVDKRVDLHRASKPAAGAEMAGASQAVLPMLRLPSLVAVAGESITASVHVATKGDALDDVDVEVRFGSRRAPGEAATRCEESLGTMHVDHLGADATHHLGTVVIAAPTVAGSHDLVIGLYARGQVVAANDYPMLVVPRPRAAFPVHVLGDAPSMVDALGGVQAHIAERPSRASGRATATFVTEEGLDQSTGAEVRRLLAAGEVVVILAQPESAAAHYPISVDLDAVETGWGSSVFQFTTGQSALPSFPRRDILVAEDATIRARSVVTRIDGEAFPDTPVVIAYKQEPRPAPEPHTDPQPQPHTQPAPGAVIGTMVGSHPVGPGRLVFCQYRLCAAAATGDAAARALLADLIRWASQPRPTLIAEATRLADGRQVARYSHTLTVAR